MLTSCSLNFTIIRPLCVSCFIWKDPRAQCVRLKKSVHARPTNASQAIKLIMVVDQTRINTALKISCYKYHLQLLRHPRSIFWNQPPDRLKCTSVKNMLHIICLRNRSHNHTQPTRWFLCKLIGWYALNNSASSILVQLPGCLKSHTIHRCPVFPANQKDLPRHLAGHIEIALWIECYR
jgi:hypothetical protein